MADLSTEVGLKGRALYEPVRLALTGRTEGPELAQVVGLLGAERCRDRLERALGGASATQ